MEKIEEMVKKLGGSAEMATSLLEEMNAYVDEERKKLDEEFQGKFGRAKKACLEETERYKGELARKVEIWLEARTETISREMRKQAAIGESGATRCLQDVKRLIEGIEIEHPGSQAAKEANKLKATIARLQEEKEAESKAKRRAFDISQKLLEHNKKLQRRINEEETSEETNEKDLAIETPKTTREPDPVTQITTQEPQEIVGDGDDGVSQIAAGLEAEPAYIR